MHDKGIPDLQLCQHNKSMVLMVLYPIKDTENITY